MQLRRLHNLYPSRMASFILWLGISSVFGAVAHSVHYQLGTFFFNVVFYLMNASSLVAMYYCFSGTYTYFGRSGPRARNIRIAVAIWLIVLLLLAAIYRQFLLIKVHAGIVLIYSMGVHWVMYRANSWPGNRLYVIGGIFSLGSVLVHSLRLSVTEWFNYKDIAHVFMIAALIVMARGIRLIGDRLTAEPVRL
jgi:hypothetical protein